jgi:hypothetical protein
MVLAVVAGPGLLVMILLQILALVAPAAMVLAQELWVCRGRLVAEVVADLVTQFRALLHMEATADQVVVDMVA